MTNDVLYIDDQWCNDWPHDVDMVWEKEKKENEGEEFMTKTNKNSSNLKFLKDHISVRFYTRFSLYKLCQIIFCYLVCIYPLCDVHVNCAPTRHGSKTLSSQTYLLQFGYLPQSGFEIRDQVSSETMRTAVESFQRFGHINVTGVIDEDTVRLMKKPRCGVPDNLSGQFNSRRRSKRYTVQGQQWDDTGITWSLKKRSQDSRIDNDDILRELEKAFGVWQGASHLTFHRLNDRDADKAQIQIVFEKGPHNDGYPFDGKGSILAHAFFPGSGQGGDVHFDDDEIWQVSGRKTREGTRLFAVAAHEFGHSLGLSHSDVEGALMYPWYQTFDDNFALPEDDKRGIAAIYGWKRTDKDRIPTRQYPTKVPEIPPSYPTHKPSTPRGRHPAHDGNDGRPKSCDTSYDAISVIRQELFIFKGRYFWRFASNQLSHNELSHKYPALIANFWSGLPTNLTHVDAVYERDQHVVFFIGQHYYVFNGQKLFSGPTSLTKMKISHTIDKIDGAMTWGHNDKTYLFSGSQYWRLDDTNGKFEVEPDYPRDMYVWKGIPYDIDAVLRWRDNHVYFFKGKVFWEFDDRKMQARSETPSLSAPFWMGCTSEPIPGVPRRTDVSNPSSASKILLHYTEFIFLLCSFSSLFLFS